MSDILIFLSAFLLLCGAYNLIRWLKEKKDSRLYWGCGFTFTGGFIAIVVSLPSLHSEVSSNLALLGV